MPISWEPMKSHPKQHLKAPATAEQVEANYRRILFNDFRNRLAMLLAEMGADSVVKRGIIYVELAPGVWVDFTAPELGKGPHNG